MGFVCSLRIATYPSIEIKTYGRIFSLLNLLVSFLNQHIFINNNKFHKVNLPFFNLYHIQTQTYTHAHKQNALNIIMYSYIYMGCMIDNSRFFANNHSTNSYPVRWGESNP